MASKAPSSETTSDQLVSDTELPNLEEVTPKLQTLEAEVTPKLSEMSMEEQPLKEAKEIPLPSVTSDDDEFHEASESVSLEFLPFLCLSFCSSSSLESWIELA